jgi:outer membrane protein TolC
VEAQVAQAELLETRAANVEAITLEQVRIQLRLPVDAKIEIGERVIDVPALPALMTLDVAWAEAQRSRPELLALAQNEQLLRHQADAASGAELPRVDAFGEILTANPNARYQPAVDAFKTTWALGVQASWSVNDFPANAAARRGLVAQANAVAAQSNAMKQALRAELVSSLRGVTQAHSTIAAAGRGVQAAEAAYRVRKDLYLAGRAKSVELTDSETELTRARIDYIDALIDARIATVRLEHALARDVK